MQDYSEQKFQELRKIDQQNEFLNKETKILKYNQIEFLEMRNKLKEMKSEIANLENKTDQMQERISVIKHRNLETIQKEEETEE